MGLFSRKKDKDGDKKPVVKTDKVEVAKKQVKDDKKDVKVKSMKDLYDDNPSTGSGRGEEDKAKTGKKAEPGKKPTKNFHDAYKILSKPLITEKAANLGVENKYVFAVAPRANKVEIAKAMEAVYGIKPVKINIIKMKGKKVRSGRIIGRRQDWKKAIIALPAGKTIKVYEGV